MKRFYLIIMTVILAVFSQHTMAISKAYDEELMVTVIEGEPCFYLKNNNFNNQKKEDVEFLIDIYVTGSITTPLLSERRLIKTPRDKNSCMTLSSLNKTLPKTTWQQDTPYLLFLSDGTVYYSEFCLQEDKVLRVESIPDPHGVKNATKQCTDIPITELPKKHNNFINWVLNLFG